MAFYEIVYIVRPDVATNTVEQAATKFAGVVKEAGGKVIKTENWGLKPLAYRVKKHRKGYYTMLGVDGDGAMLNEVERQLRLSDDIIRFLSIKVDEMNEAPSVQMAPRGRRFEKSNDSDDTSDELADA